MARNLHRIAWTLAFASLAGLAVQASAQRGGGGSRGGTHQASGAHRGGGGAKAGTHQATGTHRGGNANHAGTANKSANVNRNANVNKSANVNRNANVNNNVNVNRNVNVNNNVNVNRNVHWNGNTWGGARVVAPRYVWPHGYAYVRRPVGYIMPRPFLAPAYYYTSWATLGLAAPHHGYQWVRYGSDLLLVDTVTGRVADVRYGIFQ